MWCLCACLGAWWCGVCRGAVVCGVSSLITLPLCIPPVLCSLLLCRRAVVLWLVAVLPARLASLALLPCSSSAVYRVILFRSFRVRSSSLPLPCGLLFAFGGRPRVGASYPFLYSSGQPSSLARILPCPVRVLLCLFSASAPLWTWGTAYGGAGCGRGGPARRAACYLRGPTLLRWLVFMWRCHGFPIRPYHIQGVDDLQSVR